jgi:hypothetical protein
MWKLFWVGVMSQSLFSLTRNLLVIWPLFHAVGVMLDFAVNIGAVEGIGHDLPWAVGAVAVMAAIGVGSTVVSNRNRQHAGS